MIFFIKNKISRKYLFEFVEVDFAVFALVKGVEKLVYQPLVELAVYGLYHVFEFRQVDFF